MVKVVKVVKLWWLRRPFKIRFDVCSTFRFKPIILKSDKFQVAKCAVKKFKSKIFLKLQMFFNQNKTIVIFVFCPKHKSILSPQKFGVIDRFKRMETRKK